MWQVSILMSRTSNPLALNRLWMISSCLSSLLLAVAPDSSASAFFVISSFVGPRPPVTITISFSLNSWVSVPIMQFRSSPIDTILETFTPISLRASEIFEEFVSTTCPIRISSPIVQMDALIISPDA